MCIALDEVNWLSRRDACDDRSYVGTRYPNCTSRLYDDEMNPRPPLLSIIGKSSAFDQFVEERTVALQRFVTNMGAGTEDAKDLVQETLIRLMRYRDSAPPEEWTPLSYRILLNLYRDRQRQAASGGQVQFVPIDEQVAQRSTEGRSPETRFSDQQQLSLAREAILGLPDRCREVYLLSRIENLSYPTIAQRCGISVKAVEKHISRALRDLRAKIDRSASAQGES
jgi:RNA polymerase sigma factor (sigma-70 family)